MSQDMSGFDRQLVDITTKVVNRWGLDCPQNPSDPKKAVTVALKQAIMVAASKPFVPVYPNDHGWSSLGLRGLSVSRLKQDDEPTRLQKAGEEWGVIALAEGFDCSIIIPLMADLSEDAARSVASFVEENKTDFLMIDELPSLMARQSKSDPLSEDSEVFITIAALSWDEIRDISQNSNLPLSEAIFFRRPVSWDMLRARMSGANCPPFHDFSEKDFHSRRDRSVKFDKKRTEGTIALLKNAAKKDVDLKSPLGRNWFALVVDGLNSLGIGKPMEGLSVILTFQAFDRDFGASGLRNLCIGYGLDPLQASFLLDLAEENPSMFHLLDNADGKIFRFSVATVIPDMLLAAVNATIDGRDPEAYKRLMAATQSKGEFLNA